jgi:hypothetical protein
MSPNNRPVYKLGSTVHFRTYKCKKADQKFSGLSGHLSKSRETTGGVQWIVKWNILDEESPWICEKCLTVDDPKLPTLQQRKEIVLEYLAGQKVSLTSYCQDKLYTQQQLSHWQRSYFRGEFEPWPGNDLASRRSNIKTSMQTLIELNKALALSPQGEYSSKYLQIVRGVGILFHELRIVAKISIPRGTNLGYIGGILTDDSSGSYKHPLSGKYHGQFLDGSAVMSSFLKHVRAPSLCLEGGSTLMSRSTVLTGRDDAPVQRANVFGREMLCPKDPQHALYFCTFAHIKRGEEVLFNYGEDFWMKRPPLNNVDRILYQSRLFLSRLPCNESQRQLFELHCENDPLDAELTPYQKSLFAL